MKLDMTVSFGNLLIIATVIGSVSAAYSSLASAQSEQDRRLSRVEISQQDREARVRALEINVAGQASDLRNIQIGINEIKASLEKMTDPGR